MARNPDIDSALLQELVNYIGSYQLRYSKDAKGNRAYTRALTLLTTQVLRDIDGARDQLIVDSVPEGRSRVILPLVIAKSTANTQETTMYQLDDGHYLDSTTDAFNLGDQFIPEGAVSYPTGFPAGTTIGRIQSQILDSETILVEGKDYAVVEDTVVFYQDPFTLPGFTKYDVVDDQMLVLWGADMLTTSAYGRAFFGYLLKLFEYDSERYQTILEAAWTVAYQSPTPLNINSYLGRVLNIPVVQEPGKVTSIDETTIVVGEQTYKLTGDLKSEIRIGDLLSAGTFLQPGIGVYSGESGPVNSDSSLFNDVAVVHLPKGFNVDAELSLQTLQVPVTYHGLDSNGNVRIKFDVGPKTDLVWDNIWQRMEQDNVNLADFIEGAKDISPLTPVGTTISTINPLQFILNNFLGNNVFLIHVEVDVVPDNTRLSYINFLTQHINANIAVLINFSATPDGLTEYDLGDVIDIPQPFRGVTTVDIAGTASTLTYRDSITPIWVPSSC